MDKRNDRIVKKHLISPAMLVDSLFVLVFRIVNARF